MRRLLAVAGAGAVVLVGSLGMAVPVASAHPAVQQTRVRGMAGYRLVDAPTTVSVTTTFTIPNLTCAGTTTTALVDLGSFVVTATHKTLGVWIEVGCKTGAAVHVAYMRRKNRLIRIGTISPGENVEAKVTVSPSASWFTLFHTTGGGGEASGDGFVPSVALLGAHGVSTDGTLYPVPDFGQQRMWGTFNRSGLTLGNRVKFTNRSGTVEVTTSSARDKTFDLTSR